jgi:hypothetical protein
VLCYNLFFAKVQETAKPLQRILQSPKLLIFKDLVDFFAVIAVILQCIEKNRVFACKNRTKWAGGLGIYFFAVDCKTAKNFIKCLIFNGLPFCSILCSGFAVALQWLKTP